MTLIKTPFLLESMIILLISYTQLTLICGSVHLTISQATGRMGWDGEGLWMVDGKCG